MDYTYAMKKYLGGVNEYSAEEMSRYDNHILIQLHFTNCPYNLSSSEQYKKTVIEAYNTVDSEDNNIYFCKLSFKAMKIAVTHCYT